MPEINMEKIDGAYHLWIDGRFCGVFDSLMEVSKAILKEEENERNDLDGNG